MLLRHLKGFIHTLTDGDAGHHHNELAPAVVFIQLVHGFDVSVGLADAGLHLDGQVVMPLQMLGGLELTCTLHLLQMFQNNAVRQLWHNALVAPACKIVLISKGLLVVDAAIHHVCGREIRLTGEDIHHSFRRVRLELLMFKL